MMHSPAMKRFLGALTAHEWAVIAYTEAERHAVLTKSYDALQVAQDKLNETRNALYDLYRATEQTP